MFSNNPFKGWKVEQNVYGKFRVVKYRSEIITYVVVPAKVISPGETGYVKVSYNNGWLYNTVREALEALYMYKLDIEASNIETRMNFKKGVSIKL